LGFEFVEMKISILVGVTSVLHVVSAYAVGPRQVGGNGVIAAPVWRRDQSRSVENDLARRDLLVKRQTANTVPLALDNPPSKLLYYANSTSLPTATEVPGLTECSYDRDASSENCVTVGYGIK